MVNNEAGADDWLTGVISQGWSLLAKRLSANDTGLTGGHQAGPFLTTQLAYLMAPTLDAAALNPKQTFDFRLQSHDQVGKPTLTHYNGKLLNLGTRNECRLTGFGGVKSALNDPESTGAVFCLAFRPGEPVLEGWLARTLEEEEAIEALLGPITPGSVVSRFISAAGEVQLDDTALTGSTVCSPLPEDLPTGWLELFPSGATLAEYAADLANVNSLDADRRLLRRVRCEYQVFKVVEAAHLLPKIRTFDAVEPFLVAAQSALQRRKARAGRSLELQLRRVFREENVVCDWGKVTEQGKIPDVLFPSIEHYLSAPTGAPTLFMLAVKTSLKDRWRQVLDEAQKIPHKHLFTLAEGVSVQQFAQMKSANLTLVVPRENRRKFPVEVRSELLDLQEFIKLVR